MIRELTSLIDEVRMFQCQDPDILPEQMDALTRRLSDFEKERRCKLSILANL